MNEDRALLEKVLKESFYFKGLSSELLQELISLAVLKRYDKSQEIFSEGERALGFFLILEGNVKIYKLSPKGKEQIIHLLGPGDVFAEVVLSGLETYPACAQALTPSKLAFFEKARFLRLIQRKPELALNLIGLFSMKLRALVKTIENLTLREAGERLQHFLWELSEEGKTPSFEIKVNKSHLALLLGITPETLSRLFQKFKDEGLLEIEGKKITLKNLEKWKSLIKGF